MFPQFIGVTGLPRAGSTLLCQLLAQHPDIRSEGHSSPLANMLLGLRRMVSDDSFFLAQLDTDFDRGYGHLRSAMRGFLRGWHEGSPVRAVVDKNRAWLHCIELLLEVEPDARLVVCVRELGQVYGSIEAQHQSTILIDFTDHLGDHDRFGRADALFAKDKAIGAPLIGLHALADLPADVLRHVFVMRFEDLVADALGTMARLHGWLGLPAATFDPSDLRTGPRESDSHYRMKYLHRQSTSLRPPAMHAIPPRIQARIEAAYPWFYQAYYPAHAGARD
jgi:sulfotransferase